MVCVIVYDFVCLEISKVCVLFKIVEIQLVSKTIQVHASKIGSMRNFSDTIPQMAQH
jgi:hypothetical protein